MSERRKQPGIMEKEVNWEDRNIRKLPKVKAKYPELVEREANREEDGKNRKCPKMEDRNIRKTIGYEASREEGGQVPKCPSLKMKTVGNGRL